MGGRVAKGGMPLAAIGLIFLVLLAAGVYYYYTNYMQGEAPGQPAADPYGQQLEALNSEIYSAQTPGAAEAARQKALAIESSLSSDPSYSNYVPLAEAQLATLGVIDLSISYLSEAGSYMEGGVDCSGSYSSLISQMESASSAKASARSKAQSYLSSNPDSTASLLVSRLDSIDAGTLGVFAQMLERDIAQNCPSSNAPSQSYPTPLSAGDALELAVNEVVKGNPYYVYALPEPLSQGDVITFMHDSGDFDLAISGETWFFYVDEQPFAPFSHPTKFVLVSRSTAEFTVYEEDYYPIINGISYWSTFEERLNQSNIAYPQNATVEFGLEPAYVERALRQYMQLLAGPGSGIPVGTPVPFPDEKCCEGVDKKRFALVVTGYDEPMFRGDTADMYGYLKGQGYGDGDITYLTTSAGTANSDGVTTLENFWKALDNIANNAGCCDEVFIYLSGHGKSVQQWRFRNKVTGKKMWINSLDQLEGNLADWTYDDATTDQHRITVNPGFTTPGPPAVNHGSADGGRIFSWQIAEALDKIKSCYVTVMYFSCYSGKAGPNLAGKGRTIIAPTNNTPAWGWTAGGSWFTRYFIQAKTDAAVKNDADADKDGKVSDKEAYDWAKPKTKDFVDYKVNATQESTYTEPVGRCRCCHVICPSDKICAAVEGDGSDTPLCPKIGDYCGTMERPPPQDNETPLNGTGGQNTTPANETGGQDGTGAAVCGDGSITPPEECDYGVYGVNRCAEGKYCTKECKCNSLETNIICGDGKISYPPEDCDGGNVLTSVCLSGYRCKICRCEAIQAVCGDGRIDAPEECDHGNTGTKRCNVTGEVCQNCQCIPGDQATHRECVDEVCATVQGYGEDSCYSDSQCQVPRHSVCVENQCIEVEGEGADQCQSNVDCEEQAECGDGDVEGWEECEFDDDCGQDQACIDCLCYDIPAYCGDGDLDEGEECEYDSDCGEGQACGSNCKCVDPPSLNCDSICAQMNLPIVIGHGYTNADSCADAAREEPTACYTTCIMSGFYRVDNIAGWDSCCCKKKEIFPCSDCPGQNPQCPECPSEYR